MDVSCHLAELACFANSSLCHEVANPLPTDWSNCKFRITYIGNTMLRYYYSKAVYTAGESKEINNTYIRGFMCSLLGDITHLP